MLLLSEVAKETNIGTLEKHELYFPGNLKLTNLVLVFKYLRIEKRNVSFISSSTFCSKPSPFVSSAQSCPYSLPGQREYRGPLKGSS